MIYFCVVDYVFYIDDFKNKLYGYMDYILIGVNFVGNFLLLIFWIKDNLFVNLLIDLKIYEDEKLLLYVLWIEEFLKENNE